MPVLTEERKKSATIRSGVAKRSRNWFIINTILTIIYLAWRFFYTIPLGYGAVSAVAGIALFTVEFFGMLEAMVHYFNMHDMKNLPLPDPPHDRYPHVDIFIATYNEPVELLYKTVNGCKYLDYPDQSKVHIYLCDDGRRPQVRQLAERMGVSYFDRPSNEHAKAGNLNNALQQTTSPIVVTLDADMIPKHEFLMQTVPYFVAQDLINETKEEKERQYVGFVQSPQAFYNPDLFQHNLFLEGKIPNEQDFFYRDVQVSRNKSNSAIYGGSNTVLSRRALQEVGGFFTGSITEDYATGILIQKKKYLCYAIPEVLASGLSPQDFKSLISQRVRWGRGVIDTNRKMHIWLSPQLSFAQKVNYWASKWYWYFSLKRLIYVLSPILYGVFGYMVIRCTLLEVLLFWLPMYISSNISLRLLSGNIRSTKWTAIYETILFPFLLLPMTLESFGVSLKKFKVTEKSGTVRKRPQRVEYSIPFLLLIVLSVIGIVRCISQMLSSGSLGPIIVLFWLCFNLFLLTMAVFFVLGRDFQRKSERAIIAEPCELIVGSRRISAMTKDISETGLSVLVQQPVNIDEEDEVQIEIKTERYRAILFCTIIHSDILPGGVWKYAFHIHDYEDTYPDFLQIIYDRTPTLPQKLEGSSGAYYDLRVNVSKRVIRQFYQRRKRTRVPLDTMVYDTKGLGHRVLDINFKFLIVEGPAQEGTVTLVIESEPSLFLDCERVRSVGEDRSLLEIMNYDELVGDVQKITALEQWVFQQFKASMDGEAHDLQEAEAEGEGAKEEEAKEEEKAYFSESDYL